MTTRRFVPAVPAVIAAAALHLAPTSTRAQSIPVADPATVARYDANHNGVLDPSELAAMQSDRTKAAAAARESTVATPPADQKPLQLSPFTVESSKDSGYYAENTLAGSRINSNIADLAASITVVTKQEMDDTAAVDINDVFKYEANTEGSSTYSPSIVDRGTVKDTIAGYTYGNNGDTTTAAQSNRIRGLAAPDAALDNFSVNNRIPFDAYNTQSIEITRGPNSLLFGLGTPAGVVNQNASQAVLNRDTNTVTVRTDQNGSYRTSLALNRSLIRDKLAVFGAMLYDNRQFERKPSRDLYRRQYGAFTYKPFAKTVIRGFAENYLNDANRPNFFTPRDEVTPWLANGRPAYDPTTRMVTVLATGKTYGPYVSSRNSPGYSSSIQGTRFLGGALLSNTASPLYIPGIVADDNARPIRLIDNGQTVNFFDRSAQFYAPAQTNPATATPSAASLGWGANDPHYLILDRMWTASVNPPPPTVTMNGKTYTFGNYQYPGVTNQSIYDWTKYNTLQTNFSRVHASNYNLELEQEITPDLFFTAGWLRQDIDETDNYTLNSLTGATLTIDTNQKLPDGRSNPYFGLPFISEGVGGGLDTFYSPETDDNYRAMLAYNLDFTRKSNWLRWLGHHRLVAAWQEQDVIRSVERWRMNFVDGDAVAKLHYTRNLALPNQAMWSNTATMRKYYMADPGAPQATVTHSLSFYGNQGWNHPVTSNVEMWNYQTNNYETHRIVENTVFADPGSYKTQREVKGGQFALQSYLWQDRLVTTLGWRRDQYRARVTTTGAITDASGHVVETPLTADRLYLNGFNGQENRDLIMNRWNHWDKLSGGTKTLGGAFRPFRGLGFLQRLGTDGSLLRDFFNGLTFYYNSSDNFNPPATFQTDMFFKPLPKPTGKGTDVGVGISLFNNKLVARLNWYKDESDNERTGAAGLLLGRVTYIDTTLGLPWAATVERIRLAKAAGRTLNPDTRDPNSIFANSNWNSDAIWNVSSEAEQRKLYDMLKLPYLYFSGLSSGATQNSQAKGLELQLTFNPTRNWTMKITGSKNTSVFSHVAPQYDAWLATRMPVWTSVGASDIPDFTDPNNGIQFHLGNFWNAYGYSGNARIENTNGNTSTQAYYQNVVDSQVAFAKALEGAVSPMLRKYHASFLTNYVLNQEMFGGRLKGFSIGGSLRWESKAAIGFYGKPASPTSTVLSLADVNRPIYDNGNYYSDVWLSYSRKIDHDRIGMKIQLNCNNWNEGGRLMATQVNFDGSPWAFRIIDPRQWILQASFTF
ncbi:MAG TPA: TonB-dependent receptor plug domain-containing protein [Opitutaceae bacterium]|nr:TonB-dependent receptor plug domain-containing protein [Opitutaceae bacterium]